MSHAYAQHAHHNPSKPPPAVLVPSADLLEYVPDDDAVYKRACRAILRNSVNPSSCFATFAPSRGGFRRAPHPLSRLSSAGGLLTPGRYFSLKSLVHALEDENNMLALKLAQITTRCRDAEIARLRSLEKSHLASLARSQSQTQSRQTSQVSAYPDARVRSRSASTAAGAHRGERKTSGKRSVADLDLDLDADLDMDTEVDRQRGERLRGYSDDEDQGGIERGREIGPGDGGGAGAGAGARASAHRALEDLMDEPSGVGAGGKPRSKGSAAAINE